MKTETTTITTTLSFTYSAYRDLVIRLAETGATTGVEQTPERIEATKLNAQRMKRIDKQIQIREDLASLIQSINKRYNWTVIAEAWCGDGAQNLPVISKLASLNPNIELKIILRDENPDIMDQHLTKGSRSIPILICTDTFGVEFCIWGPRPHKIAEMATNFKYAYPYASHDEFVKHLHLWYAKDKGESIQEDFLLLTPEWKK
jgi:hypothetical protein